MEGESPMEIPGGLGTGGCVYSMLWEDITGHRLSRGARWVSGREVGRLNEVASWRRRQYTKRVTQLTRTLFRKCQSTRMRMGSLCKGKYIFCMHTNSRIRSPGVLQVWNQSRCRQQITGRYVIFRACLAPILRGSGYEVLVHCRVQPNHVPPPQGK